MTKKTIHTAIGSAAIMTIALVMMAATATAEIGNRKYSNIHQAIDALENSDKQIAFLDLDDGRFEFIKKIHLPVSHDQMVRIWDLLKNSPTLSEVQIFTTHRRELAYHVFKNFGQEIYAAYECMSLYITTENFARRIKFLTIQDYEDLVLRSYNGHFYSLGRGE